MVSRTEVIVDRGNLWIAHSGHLCIAYPRGETDAALISDVTRGFNLLVERAPAGIGLLFVSGAESPPPTDEMRDAAYKMFADFAPKLKLLAAYVEGSDFAAAAKHGLFTLLVSRLLRDKPVKTFGRIADATDWVESQANEIQLECPTSEELQLVIDRVASPGKQTS
jgi:hypothetical protein